MNQTLNLIAARHPEPELTEGDVRALRQAMLEEGFGDRGQAEALFMLDARAGSKCDAWTELFVEAMTDYVVWQLRPTGVVTPDKADWLLALCDETQTPARLALLVNVLAEAHLAPKGFIAEVRNRAATWAGVAALATRRAA
ncbi:MAG: hypothetical protein JWL93_1243 [Hyphomicrobiales bacterium]|nr:hypothetical protein [Hyphomicrobiales bacterium]